MKPISQYFRSRVRQNWRLGWISRQQRGETITGAPGGETKHTLKIQLFIAYHIAKEESAFVKFGPLIASHEKNTHPTYEGLHRRKPAAAHYLDVLINGHSDNSKHKMWNSLCVALGKQKSNKPPGWITHTLEHSQAVGRTRFLFLGLYYFSVTFSHKYSGSNMQSLGWRSFWWAGRIFHGFCKDFDP